VLGRYGNFRASQAIGANLSGPVIQLSLLVTLTLAILVLKEPLTPLRVLGIALLASGPALMRNAGAEATEVPANAPHPSLPRSRGRVGEGVKFVPRYAEGYAFALLAALLYGVTPFMVRPEIA